MAVAARATRAAAAAAVAQGPAVGRARTTQAPLRPQESA